MVEGEPVHAFDYPDYLSVSDREAYLRLGEILRELGSVAVAFSGGVDSTLLLAAARRALGLRVLAVTALSPVYPSRETALAREFAARIRVKHLTLPGPPLDSPCFADNPDDRCYHCKAHIFREVKKLATKYGIEHLADGTNLDDLGEDRPGMRAGDELGVRRPLVEAGFDKARVRRWARALDLPNHDEPARACLATRIPHGVSVTLDKLESVARAEDALYDLGFRVYRVRHQGGTGRVEIAPAEMGRLEDPLTRAKVKAAVEAAGFVEVLIDPEGYRKRVDGGGS